MSSNLQVGQSVRQGDVVLRLLAPFSPNATPTATTKSHVLALGEKTGHSHVLELEDAAVGDIELFQRGEVLYLRTSAPATLKHQEHGDIAIAPGSYQVHKQREQAERDTYRQVID